MKTRLQYFRKRAGYRSAKAFAEHLGMSARTYTNYEQGATKLTLAAAWVFADELGCTLDELAGRDFSHDQSETLTENEMRIVQAYRAATPQGRAAIEAVAQSQEGMEGKSSPDLADTG